MRAGAKLGWALCAPSVLALAAVAGFPLARTVELSLKRATLARFADAPWAGLSNYAYVLGDPDWWMAVRNTLLFTGCSVLLETVLGLGLALLLNARLFGRGLVRAAVLVPWAIPAVVSARMWAWMFNDLYGVINELIRRLGLGSGQVAWLADERLALLTMVVVDAWKTTPFVALLLLAGLQGIPANVREAARLDGASPWQEFRSVTWPLLRPALLVALLFRTLDALRVFDLPFVLTSGSRSTSVISIYARQQLVDFQDVGAGSAASSLVFCLVGAVAAVYLALGRESLGVNE
jgi:trehalose/maltose transport system permease protein